MSTRSVSDTQARDGSDVDPIRAGGWLVFGGVMLIFAGVTNVLDGIIALSKSSFYVAEAEFVFSDLETWAWILIAVGAVQTLSGIAVMGGSEAARWFGIGCAAFNAIAQLGFVQAFPLWSMAIFAVDILIIYALVVYGGRRPFET